jgi:membrane protein implicated in regulation of membrane protease activity
MKLKSLVLGLVLTGLSGVALAQAGLTQAQVRAKLETQGYTKVNDLKFEDGVWKADARSADGNRVDVRIDAATGEVFPDEQVANLGEADVRAKLAAAGYTNVHDVDYEDGIWNAEADDPAGKDVEVKIDPKTGAVIGKEKD